MFCVNKDKCDGCGSCVDVCPTGAVTLDPETGLSTIDPEICAECGACEQECPVQAIIEVVDDSADNKNS